jgi:hypothetical protein
MLPMLIGLDEDPSISETLKYAGTLLREDLKASRIIHLALMYLVQS